MKGGLQDDDNVNAPKPDAKTRQNTYPSCQATLLFLNSEVVRQWYLRALLDQKLLVFRHVRLVPT